MLKRVGLALLGLYVGLLAAIVHRHETNSVPWGIVAAIGATWLVARGAGAVLSLGVAWFGLGWALSLMVTQFAPGGGYLVGSDGPGWIFIVGSLGAIVAATFRTPRVGAIATRRDA